MLCQQLFLKEARDLNTSLFLLEIVLQRSCNFSNFKLNLNILFLNKKIRIIPSMYYFHRLKMCVSKTVLELYSFSISNSPFSGIANNFSKFIYVINLFF